MGLKPDHWIRKMALEHRMIEPFIEGQVRNGVISYGVSSYGYDIRVADEFKIFTNVYSAIVDPKNFDPKSMVDYKGEVCVIPPNSFALARTIEYFRIPRNVLTICLGKSTYARCGIIVNVTPFEPCYSADTEILTPTGWQTFDKLIIGSLVMTMNPDIGMAEWQPVERKQSYHYEGDMVHFDGRNIDLLVTPDHEVLVSMRNSRQNRWSAYKKVRAEDVYGKYNYRMTRQVQHWRGEDIEDTIHVGELRFDTNTFLNFLGTYLGDGSAYINKGGYVIKIAAMTDHDLERVQTLITSLGFTPNYDGRSWRFFSKDLYNLLKPLGHAHEKYVPRNYVNLPPYRLEHLLKGLMESDGTSITQTYTTVSKQLADDVQEIIFKIGSGAIIRKTEPPKGKSKGAFKGNHPVYKVRQAFTQLTPKINPSMHKRVPYCGTVYDVTVQNHIIFVRRNGKPVWSGNCWEGFVTLEISNTTPLPAKIYANEGIAQVLFFEADEECEISYADKKGKYQGQQTIVLPRL